MYLCNISGDILSRMSNMGQEPTGHIFESDGQCGRGSRQRLDDSMTIIYHSINVLVQAGDFISRKQFFKLWCLIFTCYHCSGAFLVAFTANRRRYLVSTLIDTFSDFDFLVHLFHGLDVLPRYWCTEALRLVRCQVRDIHISHGNAIVKCSTQTSLLHLVQQLL